MSLNGGVFRIDPAPQQAMRSVATLPSFVGDTPPGISYARAALFALTVGAWTTPQPIQRGPVVTASGSAAVIDQVPAKWFPIVALTQPWAPLVTIQTAPRLVQGTPLIVLQVPPTRVPLVELASWSVATGPLVTAPRLVQDGTPVVVFVPATRRPSVELSAWSGGTAVLPSTRFAPLPSVDEPPRQSGARLAATLDTTWRPVVGVPQRAPFVVQGIAPALVTYVPRSRFPFVELSTWAVLPWTVGPSRLIAAWVDPGTPIIPVDPSNPFNIPQGSALPYRFIRHRR